MRFVIVVLASASTLVVLHAGSSSARETRVTIPSDEWMLVGTFRAAEGPHPSGAAVLLLHGAARDRRAYIPLAAELARRGVASLRLDLRGEGESTNLGRFEPGQSSDLLKDTSRDVAAALAWLRARPGGAPERVGLLTASYSAEEAAIAARAGATAAAHVLLSPGNFSDESIRGMDISALPWWVIASRDERFAHTVATRIAEESRTAKVTFVEGTSHASDILSAHYALNAEIADWFAARLAGLTPPRLWGGLAHGAYPVGFRRESAGDRVIDTWYPAAPGLQTAAVPMTFGDYVRLADDLRGADPDTATSPTALRRTVAAAITGDAAGITDAVLDDLTASPMAAHRDALPGGGRFPLLLWTPRYATTVAQTVLSEFLASHGFAVVFARPAVTPSALPFELESSKAKAAELRARVEDMSLALSRVQNRSEIDATRVGVLAWSYTGEMATAFQQREPRVSLVAGLSTTLLSDWVYQEQLALQALNTRALGATYAVFTEDRARALTQPPLPEERSYVIELPGLRHGNFNALEGFIPSMLGIGRVQRWSWSGSAGVTGYETIGTLLLRLARQHVADRAPRAMSPLALRTGLPSAAAVVHRPTTARRLAQPFNDMFPAWSPRGDRIAFMSDRNGDPEIYTVRVDGSDLRRLTDTPGRDAHPSWSPDGKLIAFQSPRQNGHTRIFLMNADGTAQRPITSNTGFCGVPVWSPDGRRLAYQCSSATTNLGSADAPWRIFLLDVAAKTPPELLTRGPGNDQVPNWSPDGTRLVFYSNRSGRDQLYTVDVASGLVSPLTRGPGAYKAAAYSPDGQHVAFLSDVAGPPADVYVMNVDGSQSRRLTTTGPEHGVPFFSPDGRRLLYQGREDGYMRVWMMDVSGANAVRVNTGDQPATSGAR